MEITKEKLERKLKEAKDKLAGVEEGYEKLLKVQEERKRLKRRVENLTKKLSEL